MSRKAVNDSVAYLRSLAELRERNAEFAEAAVRDAATLTATQAHAQGVIEILAADLPTLLRQADGRRVTLAHRDVDPGHRRPAGEQARRRIGVRGCWP